MRDKDLGPDMNIIEKVTMRGPVPCLEMVFDDKHIQCIYAECLDKIIKAITQSQLTVEVKSND